MVGITQARIVPALESLDDFEKSFPGSVFPQTILIQF